MRNSLTKIFQYSTPQFKQLSESYIPSGLYNQYSSKIFYTPKIQLIPYTQEFDKYIHYLKRRKYIEKKDLQQFTKNMIIEFHTVMKQDRPELDIMIQQNCMIPRGNLCSFHGKVDFLYSINGFNPTPILFFDDISINPSAVIGAALSNLHIRNHLRKTHPEANKFKKQINGFSIATTGHEWQLIQISQKLKLEKTFVFEGTLQHRNIYDDPKTMQTILGLLQFAMDHPRENVKVLQKAYEYLDEKRYMIEAETKEQAQKQSLFSKMMNYFGQKKK